MTGGLSYNTLGLPVNTGSDVLTNPIVLLYGAPKSGKSTDMACAFQNAFYVTSASGVLHPYRALQATNPQLASIGASAGNECTIPLSVLQGGQTLQFVQGVLGTIYQLMTAGRFPWRAVVFDEFDVMLDWMWPPLKAANSGKWADPWGVMDQTACMLLQEPKSWGLAVGVVMHEDPPKYHLDGSLKYRGGPTTPVGKMRESLCAIADVALRITLEEDKAVPKLTPGENGAPPVPAPTGPKRVLRRYHTEAHPLWQGGVRGGFHLEPMVDLGLANLLTQVGMSVT